MLPLTLAGALPNSQSPEAATIGAVIRYHAPAQNWALVNLHSFRIYSSSRRVRVAKAGMIITGSGDALPIQRE
jgi:hypothetical protein